MSEYVGAHSKIEAEGRNKTYHEETEKEERFRDSGKHKPEKVKG